MRGAAPRWRGAAAAALCLLAAYAAPAAAQEAAPDAERDAARAARVDSVFAAVNRSDGPGCAVGIVHAGALAYARGFGMANLDYGIALGPRSVFYLASVSKQFTAAAVALAAEQGHLALDDDVRRWIPELPDYGALTVRHLVHHTGGVRDYLTLMSLAGIRYGDHFTADDALRLVARQEALNFAPGTEHLYSNSGYILLAEVIRRATGRSLRAYAEAELFRPLGMLDTHFHDDPGQVVPGRVISYVPRRDGGWEVSYLSAFQQVGDGGLYSTVEDLARWDRLFYEGGVGGPGFLETLHTRGLLSGGDTLRYAFGLTIGERAGLREVAHGGSMMGFRTHLVRWPEERTSVVTLCNDGTQNPTRLSLAAAEAWLDRPLREPAAERASADSGERGEETSSARWSPSAAELAEYAGRYHSRELDADWTLVVEEGGLVLRHPSGQDRPLRPVEPGVFEGRGLELRFTRGGDGAVAAFVIAAGRVRGIRFERVDAP